MAVRALVAAALGLTLVASAGGASGNGKLAYDRDRVLYTAAEDGSSEAKLADASDVVLGAKPLWSPDGAHVAYIADVTEPGFIYTVPAVAASDGSSHTLLTSRGAFQLACWLDSTTLVAVDTESSTTTPGTVGQDLYAFGLDGSVRRLTTGGGTKYLSEQGCSPDGSAVAYSTQRPDYTFATYVAHRDAAPPTLITGSFVSDFLPAWSPDGGRLAFSRAGPTPGVYLSDPSGGNETRLTTRPASDIRWSPDGAHLAFTYSETDYAHCFKGACPTLTDVWSVAADGSDERPLAASGSDRVLDWSPDGTRLLFDRGTRSFVMNADGSCKTVLPQTIPETAGWQPVPGKAAEPRLLCADLKVTTDVQELDLPLRGSAVFTETVLNQGNVAASAVALHQDATPGIEVIDAEPTRGTCTLDNGLDCRLGPLASTESVSVRISIRVGGPGRWTLTPAAAAPETDGDPYDNSAPLFLRVHDCTVLGTVDANTLYGTRGPDRICGLFGNDAIYGGRGADVIFGGEGADIIYGGPGRDIIDGGGGNDVIFARDSTRDLVDCGPEPDTAIVDRIDIVTHCRHVFRPPKKRRQARAPR